MLFQPGRGDVFFKACEADSYRGLVAPLLDDPEYETADDLHRHVSRRRMAEDLVLLSTMEEDGIALEIGLRSAPGVIDVSRLRKSAMRGSRLPGRWCLSRHPDWPPGRRNGVATRGRSCVDETRRVPPRLPAAPALKRRSDRLAVGWSWRTSSATAHDYHPR
jgi:hypothetical protein